MRGETARTKVKAVLLTTLVITFIVALIILGNPWLLTSL
jgi:hypothetical protein